ncbi:MAG: hypothetical protein LBD07_02655 [Spirochaetaceae bacterium]|jgi:hypothetical protein|nr:hypothetical protein [Spirochaetaceae bacterium]
MNEQPVSGFVFAGENSDAAIENNVDFQLDTGSEKNSSETFSGAVSGFPEIAKLLEEADSAVFDDTAYYKHALADGGDSAKRLHAVFQKYSTAKEPSDKTLYRQQMTNAFWDYFSNVVKQICSKINDPKKFLLRFGMLYPNALAPEHKSFFSRIINDSGLDQPIYYIDEWFKLVGSGKVKASTTDEAKPVRGNENSHLRALLEKAIGKLEGTRGLIAVKNTDRESLERELKDKTSILFEHTPCPDFREINDCYSESQKAAFNQIQEILKDLHRLDREISKLITEYSQSKEDVKSIEDKISSSPEGTSLSVDLQAIDTEYNSMRQMAKMTIGRQGNPFPVLTKDYYHSMPDNVGFRENIIRKLAWVEEADCEAFIRVYKNNPNRIVPYVLLLPTYGDFGVCWEPFDKLNKATSRGRIAIPMYPKNLTIAVLTAVADFRWQVAKEIASMYWMEEGLTGNYFQWFQSQKLKGDVKLYFIQDYIAWMTKEREGVQKLEKNVRGIFWRYLPFSQPLKDKLKDRNLVYNELYQRDKNRAKSDGY